MTTTVKATGQQIFAPPRGAAIAGVIFSVIMIVCLGLVRYAIPADLTEPDPWLVEPGRRRAGGLALDLVPFAGIAFLWFVGVLRNRLPFHQSASGWPFARWPVLFFTKRRQSWRDANPLGIANLKAAPNVTKGTYT
jgi:hypothetical protein